MELTDLDVVIRLYFLLLLIIGLAFFLFHGRGPTINFSENLGMSLEKFGDVFKGSMWEGEPDGFGVETEDGEDYILNCMFGILIDDLGASSLPRDGFEVFIEKEIDFGDSGDFNLLEDGSNLLNMTDRFFNGYWSIQRFLHLLQHIRYLVVLFRHQIYLKII